MTKNIDTLEAAVASSGLTRRGAMGVAALTAAGVALPAVATAAAGTDNRLNVFEGRYAIDGHKIVDGYFVAPRGKSKLDVVVVVPGTAGSMATAREEAQRRALAGAYAIVPAFPNGAAALKAELQDTLPRLRNFAQGSGRVTLVAV